jgi:hypothetical protein
MSEIEFAPLPLIIFIAVVEIFVLSPLLIAFKQYDKRVPFVGGCSAAISAACYPYFSDEERFNMVTEQLQ